jgi:hypothetical protein
MRGLQGFIWPVTGKGIPCIECSWRKNRKRSYAQEKDQPLGSNVGSSQSVCGL